MQPIIALDKPTDATAAYFAQDRFAHWERRTYGEGDLGRVRNRLLPETDGRYIAFLDADDIWFPGKLKAQINYMEAHPDVGVIFGGFIKWTADATGKFPPASTLSTDCTSVVLTATAGGPSVIAPAPSAERRPASSSRKVPNSS